MDFLGYEELGGDEHSELYDPKNDPEELNDLSSLKRETTAELLNELKQKLAEVNEPYMKKLSIVKILRDYSPGNFGWFLLLLHRDKTDLVVFPEKSIICGR